MIRDLYDNSTAAYKTGTLQTVNLVLDTIRFAMRKEKKRIAAELQLHSDQGFQYTSQAYFQLTKQYGITPSMSRRGNPYDNAMAENFFSILKTECISRHKPITFSAANEMIDRYIHFYNYERIQFKTGEAPLTRRLSYENSIFPTRGFFYCPHNLGLFIPAGRGLLFSMIRRIPLPVQYLYSILFHSFFGYKRRSENFFSKNRPGLGASGRAISLPSLAECMETVGDGRR